MSSKLWRNVALAGVAAAGAAVWAVAPRTFNDKRRNFVPSIPEVWYAHRGHMKRETWKTVIKIALSLLTAIAASLGLTSCM